MTIPNVVVRMYRIVPPRQSTTAVARQKAPHQQHVPYCGGVCPHSPRRENVVPAQHQSVRQQLDNLRSREAARK